MVLKETLAGLNTLIDRRAPEPEVLRALNDARSTVQDFIRSRAGDAAVAAALTLKTLNLLLTKYHFLTRGARLLSAPPGMLVDPANGCNLACPGCVQSTRAKSLQTFDWTNGLLTTERFALLLSHYGPCAMQIMFCNYGEPTVNPRTPQLIGMAKAYYIQTVLSTNLALPRFDAEAYVRSGLDFMYLAVDGASQAVYSRYRKNGDIAAVYRNIEKLVAAKRSCGSATPVLRWQYLAFEHNAAEIPAALEAARALGVDQFAVETPFDVSWDDPEVRPAGGVRPFILELTQGAELSMAANWAGVMTEPAAREIVRRLSRGWTRDRAEAAPEIYQPGWRPTSSCNWLYRNLTLDANGRILPCCGAPKPGSDLVFGNLTDDGADYFNSAHYLQARSFFGDRAAYEAARSRGGPVTKCADCQWDKEHTEFGSIEIAQYLRTAGRGVFDAAAIQMCSEW